MTKRFIEIDDALLEIAIAGTRHCGRECTLDTVRAALGFAAARPGRVREARGALRCRGGMAEMADARARDDVWH